MKAAHWIASVIFGVIAANALAQEGPVGRCDTEGERERKSLEFIFESQKGADAEFRAQAPCTDKEIVVRKCAVVVVRKINVPRGCFIPGRPEYSEEVGIVEYWGEIDARDGAQR